MIGIIKGVGAVLLTIAGACQRAPSSSPAATPQPVQTGIASFYGNEFAGRETASGEPLRLDAMTAASRTLPLGTRVQVVNVATGRSARLTINDRGPYVDGRVLDVTPRAARSIGLDRDKGLAQVSISKLPAERPPGR